MEINNHELPIYRFYIHPNDLKELKNDIWNDDPVQGSLTVNKKKYDIDIVYRGAHTRELRKKSYYISFYKPKSFFGFKEIHLNAEYRDPSLIRNKLSLDFFSSLGVLAPTSSYVFITINGKSEGVYLQLESVNEQFLQKRGCPDGTIFYAIDGDANFSLYSDLDKQVKKSLELGYELKHGKQEDYNHLEEVIYNINTLSAVDFEHQIHNYVNVSQYLRWLAGVIFTQNYDGFVHNYAIYLNKQTGQIEIIPWDYDATWGRDVNGKELDYDYVGIKGFNTLTARLLNISTFRQQYKALLESTLKDQFTVENMQPHIEHLHQLLRPSVLKDPYEKEAMDVFDQEPEFILEYIKNRSKFIQDQLYKLE